MKSLRATLTALEKGDTPEVKKTAPTAKKGADMHASAVHQVQTKLVDDKEVVMGSDKGNSVSTGIAAEMESNTTSETG